MRILGKIVSDDHTTFFIQSESNIHVEGAAQAPIGRITRYLNAGLIQKLIEKLGFEDPVYHHTLEYNRGTKQLKLVLYTTRAYRHRINEDRSL